MLTIDQMKEIAKLLAEDGYEILHPANKLCPAIYKVRCRKPGVPFFIRDLLKNHNTVSEAVIYLKNLYDNQ